MCGRKVRGLCGLVLGAALVWAPGAWAAAPSVGPSWTANVGTSSASLRAEINPGGLATTYHFSYLTEAAYQANLAAGPNGFLGAVKAPAGTDPSIGSGSAAVSVSQSISSLSPDTEYRYRVEATNGSGTALGPARLFSTEPFATSSYLLDNRRWEMVSPAGGGETPGFGGSFGGGTIQAAADGEAFTYSSPTSLGDQALGAPPVNQYVAHRGAGGWDTANVSAATVAGAYGENPDGAPYQLFSADLLQAAMDDGFACNGVDPCRRGYSLRAGDGTALAATPRQPDLRLVGASPDLTQLVLSTCAALTADATEAPGPGGCDPAQPNLYRWSVAGGLELVNVPPAAVQGTPGAAIAAPAGAISDDGARVYWTLGGSLYLRDAGTGKQVDASLGGGGGFEAASRDGAVAFFSKAGHLYKYEAGSGTVSDLTPGGALQGVLGASADGTSVYYATAAGLFLHDGGAVPIASGAGAVEPGSFPAATGTARVTADGDRLAFVSKASLTGYDNRDAATGVPRSEVFLYEATANRLACVSCNPTGERPIGDSTMPAATANGAGLEALRIYKPWALIDDGRRLFFDSADALVPQDTAKQPDVYEWEEGGSGSCQRVRGCLALVSAGRNSEGARFLDASADGSDVFFLTPDSLVGADLGFSDVYDAREGGGFPEPSRPIECVGDACQALPSPPEDPTPGTLVPSGGNPPLREPGANCRKGQVKRKGKCVKKKRRKAGHGRSQRGGRK